MRLKEPLYGFTYAIRLHPLLHLIMLIQIALNKFFETYLCQRRESLTYDECSDLID